MVFLVHFFTLVITTFLGHSLLCMSITPIPTNYDTVTKELWPLVYFIFFQGRNRKCRGSGTGWIQLYEVVKFMLNKLYISFKNSLLVEYKYFHKWIKRQLSHIFCIFKLLFMLLKIDSMWFFNNQLSIIFLRDKVCVRSYCHSGFPCKGFDSNSAVLLNKTKYSRS